MKLIQYRYSILLGSVILVSFVAHAPFITTDVQGLHSWRQSQTMWNIRNFVRNDGNILNPRTNIFNEDDDNISRYEFPILQWTIAMLQRTFGEKIEIVRLAMFVIGLFATLGIFSIVHYTSGDKYVAVITALLFQFAPIFYHYTFTPLPDILALTCGIWYIYFMLRFRDSTNPKWFSWGSLFLLLATLAKLPYLMFAVVSLTILISLLPKLQAKKVIIYLAIQGVVLAPAVAWYLWVIPTWTGNPVLSGIFGGEYTTIELVKLMAFNGIKVIPNKLLSFPIWAPFGIGLYSVLKQRKSLNWLVGLICITVLFLILELTAIGRDHDYYLLSFLPWLFIVVSIGIKHLKDHLEYRNLVLLGVCMASFIYCLIITRSWYDLDKTGFNKDVFVYSRELQDVVPDNELCIILNDISGYVFSYKIDKMGYVFNNDYLPMEWVDDLVRNKGVSYMYSDSDIVNSGDLLSEYIDKILLTRGSVSVYKLKLPDGDDR